MILGLDKDEQHQHPNGGGWVANTATVDSTAYVDGDARVSGNAQVFGNAQVSGNAWVLNPLEINGSAHVVTLVSYTQIAIGCQVRTFSDWLKNYKTIGKENGYSFEQIKEYGEILKYLVKAAKVYIKRNQKLIAK